MCKRYSGQGSTIAFHWVRACCAMTCLIFLLTFVPCVYGTQPPRPGEIKALKKKKQFKKRLKFVKALGNHKMAPGLVQKFKDKKEKIKRRLLEAKGPTVEEDDASSAPGMSPSGDGFSTADDYLPPADDTKGLPTTGSPKAFALLISFNDYPHTISHDTIDAMLWGDGDAADYPRESLTNYYHRSSYGTLNLGGTTLGWYQTPYERSEVLEGYADDKQYLARQALIEEAIDHFDSLGHDFSQYDNDGDGVIDYFMVFWTGPDTGWGAFWWAYQTSFGSSHTVDGKYLGVYSWQWESNRPTVVIHETGHALGLPDYYDYDSDVGPDGGVGNFDMMDANVGDHNCFSKWLLGWLTPTAVSDGSQVVTLGDTTTQDCVLVWPGITLGDMFSEFFMIQNRQDTGNDESFYFSPDGLAIWHVDATLRLDGKYFAYNNSHTDHKLLRLMEADGLEEIESYGWVYQEDLYQEPHELSPDSVPSSAKYSGYDSCVRVWNIVDNGSGSGATITATINFVCSCSETPPAPDAIMPVAGAIDITTTPTLNWEWVSGSSFTVQVCEEAECAQTVRSASPTANYWIVDPVLDPVTEYWWRVRTNGDCNAGPWSPAWNFTTLCNIAGLNRPELYEPTHGTMEVGAEPYLEWVIDDVTLETSTVQICVDADCNTVVLSQEVPVNRISYYQHWDVTPALEGETWYWWRIRTAFGCGTSDWSDTWAFRTNFIPGTPVLVAPAEGATDLNLQPILQWQPVPGAVGYQVQLRTVAVGTFDAPLRDVTVADTHWTVDPQIYEDDEYVWRVRAISETDVFGAWSTVWGFQTCSHPSPPPSDTAFPAYDAMDVSLYPTLNWDPPDGDIVYSYHVTICSDQYCSNWVQSATVFTTGWAVTQPLDPGTLYYWRVISYNACGSGSSFKSKFTTISDCDVPDTAPQLGSPAFGETHVSVTPTLSWGLVGIGDYNVDVCNDPYCETVVRSATVAGIQWTVSPSLDLDKQYWWRVNAENDCGSGPWSAISTFSTDDCPMPAVPSLTDPGSAVDPGEGYAVKWSAVVDALDYTVQESTSLSFLKSETTTQVVSGTSRTFSHADAGCRGKAFYYRVKARNSCGFSGWSNVVDMTVNGISAPATPVPLGVSDNSPMPTLDWEDTDGADSYKVCICADGGCRETVTSATTTESAWTLTRPLDEGYTYYWQVQAENDCGDVSPWSSLEQFGPVCSVPDVPLLKDPGSAVGSSVTYTVGWTAVDGATEYRVQEATGPTFRNATTYIIDKDTSKTFSNINTGCEPNTYYYRMVAVNACGPGAVSATVDMVVNGIALPAAPVLVSPNDGAPGLSTAPTLDWGDVTGAADYEVWICEDTGCTHIARTAIVTGSSWTVTPALDKGRGYWWQVIARNPCGAATSKRWRFETACPKPDAPAIYDPGDTVASGKEFMVSWDPVVGASGYIIDEDTDPRFPGPTPYNVRDTSQIFHPTNGTCEPVTYYYRVRAVDICGTSNASATVDMTIAPSDIDRDTVCDLEDNCPDIQNTDQQDTDRDNLGDVCDPCPFDFNDDGDIDGSDFGEFVRNDHDASLKDFASHFGRTCSGSK